MKLQELINNLEAMKFEVSEDTEVFLLDAKNNKHSIETVVFGDNMELVGICFNDK